MRKILTLLFLLALKTSSVFAFQTPDLKTILASSEPETEQIKKINALAGELISAKKLNEAENALQKALEMAQKNNFDFGKAGVLDNLGLIAQNRFDYTNAMNYFVESLRIKDATSDKIGIATSKNNIGKVFFLQRNEENAMTNYQAGLASLEEAPNSSIAAEIHRNMGDVYLMQKLYGKATVEFDLALKIWAENVQDLEKAAGMASYLGKVNVEYANIDAATTYFNASLNFHRNLNDLNGIADDYINLAKLAFNQNEKEVASEYASNALSAFQQLRNEFGITQAYNLDGQIALKGGDRTNAEQSFEKSAELLRGVQPQPGMPELFKSIAESFEEMGNFPKAFACFLQGSSSFYLSTFPIRTHSEKHR